MMSACPSEPTPLAHHEGRLHERTHLFLGAVLQSKAGSCPVHVRNISSSGALIEGAAIPEPGDALLLKRAGLEAAARIVWKAGRKAGIAFSATIHVSDWASKRPSTHQDRVDEMIQTVRARPIGIASLPAEPPPPAAPGALLETELNALKGHLVALENGLTGDVVLIATHPEIQLLDVALQAVERMLSSLAAR
jgi:hypothetical protein